MGVHDGHRNRIKAKFAEQGLDSFYDHEVLELLLCYAQPRKDTNPIAHALIERFSNLKGVFEANKSDLVQVEGVGENTATLIKLIPAVSRRYMSDMDNFDNIINKAEDAGKILIPRYMFERDEVVYAICLDAKCKYLCIKEVGRGTTNTAEISIRKIVELGIEKNASGMILSHNHTSGIAIPSYEDVETTKKVKAALNAIEIDLVDHLVVAGNDFVSMKESKMI